MMDDLENEISEIFNDLYGSIDLEDPKPHAFARAVFDINREDPLEVHFRGDLKQDKLNTKSVSAIKKRLCGGETIRQIALSTGVPTSTLSQIKFGQTWKDVEPLTPDQIALREKHKAWGIIVDYVPCLQRFGQQNGRCKLSNKQVELIKAELSMNRKQRDIAAKFNISQAQISRIARGVHWK